jgi:hypothetical protein
MKKDVRCIQMQCNVNSPKIKCSLLQSLEKKEKMMMEANVRWPIVNINETYSK